MLSSEEEQNQRWVEHFSEVLDQANSDSLFDFTSENDISGNNPNTILDDIQCDELTEAIKTLKKKSKHQVLTIYQLDVSDMVEMQSLKNLGI